LLLEWEHTLYTGVVDEDKQCIRSALSDKLSFSKEVAILLDLEILERLET